MIARRLALLVLPALIYVNSLDGAFVQDDPLLIQKNELITDLSRLPEIFAGGYREGSPVVGKDYLYRPLTIASFALSATLFGLNPVGFHLFNLLLHLLVVALLFETLKRLLEDDDLCFTAALLYACHPVLTEAVANCSGRGELLAALFFLLAWRASLGETAPSIRSSVLTGVFFLFALLSKESAIVLPAVVILGDALLRARRNGESLGRELIRPLPRQLWPTLGILAGVAALYLGIRAMVLGGWLLPATEIPFVDNPAATAPTVSRILTALSVIGRYAALTAFPVALSADYSFDQIPVIDGPASIWFLAGLALALSAVVLPWIRSRDRGLVAGSLLFFWITISVASNIPFAVGTIMAERLLYLPAAGLCLLAAWLLHRIPSVRIRVALLLLLVVALGGRTVLRNRVWSDREAFITATFEDAPRSVKAIYNYGNLLRDGGDCPRAAEHYRRVIERDESYLQAWVNLAACLQTSGELDEAEQVLLRATRLHPDEAMPYSHLGRLYQRSQRFDEALAAHEAAAARIGQEPYGAEILLMLGQARVRAGDIQGARRAFEETLARDPAHAAARINLANCLMVLGDLAGAEAAFREAARRGPRDLEPRFNLGVLYARMQRFEESLHALEAAAELAAAHPGAAEVFFQLGMVRRRMGDLTGARAALDEALRRNPRHAGARELLESIPGQ